MSYNADDISAIITILRALWADVDANNIILNASVPNLKAATTLPRLRTLANRFSEGLASGCVRSGGTQRGQGAHTHKDL